jgi:hypothetical protein
MSLTDKELADAATKYKKAYTGAPLKQFWKTYSGIAIGLPLVAGTLQYFFSRKNIAKDMEDLKTSYQKTLTISNEMASNPDRSSEVFRELCAVAPSVAMNPSMAVKVIEPRLKSGLTIDDVHKLTMINANTKQSIFSRTPMGEATRAAGLVTDRVFTTFGTRAMDDFKHAGREGVSRLKNWNSAMEGKGPFPDLNKEGSMKKQSSQKVSETCAVEMMADRYVMLKQSSLCKEAGVAAEIKDVLIKARPYLLTSLAVTGLAHGIGAAIDATNSHRLGSQADEAFAKLRKSSESIKANPELAMNAFDAIKTFAPNLAAKPAVLKTFIEHSISVEGMMSPETINQLATAQGSIMRSKPIGFAGGFTEATGGMAKQLKDYEKDSKQQPKPPQPNVGGYNK